MADEPSRAARSAVKSLTDDTKGNFENVEFLDSSLADPMNLLRLKLKDLGDLPESIVIRRVLVICDVVSDEGRGIDISWSGAEDDSPFDEQDALTALLVRAQHALSFKD